MSPLAPDPLAPDPHQGGATERDATTALDERHVLGRFKAALAGVGTAALLLAAAWFSPRAVPYNMDEFVHYHALGCATALGSPELPMIRDGCGHFDLRLPLTTTPLPLRSYSYIGSLPSLPFYPFWRALGGPVAARVQGAVFAILWVLLAARILRVRTSSVILAALVFPIWLVTFVVDEGPVGFSALLLLLALEAIRAALHTPRRGLATAFAAGAGLVLFAGIWTKLVFVWWFPVVAVFGWSEARRRGLDLRSLVASHARSLAAGALALTLPAALLLASTDREGRPYIFVLVQGNLSAEPDDVEAVAKHLARYVTDGSLVAPRNISLASWPIDAAPLVLSLVLLATAWRSGARRREVLQWTVLAAGTFSFVALSGHSQWPHHFAFPLQLLVFALALCADRLSKRWRLACGAVALAFWATLGARLPAADAPADSSPDKDRLLAFVRESSLDRSTLQVHASWGTYYIAQLFGDPARLVVYARRVVDDPERLGQMADLARQQRRPILLVSSRRRDRIETPAVRTLLGPPLDEWRFGSWWAVAFPPQRIPLPQDDGRAEDSSQAP